MITIWIKELKKMFILNAKKIKCAVKFPAFGNYSVKGSKGYDTVICREDLDGNKIVQCECKGAEKG